MYCDIFSKILMSNVQFDTKSTSVISLMKHRHEADILGIQAYVFGFIVPVKGVKKTVL